MKILFCTNVFEVIENGPVKFARMLTELTQLYPEHEIHFLSEDIRFPSETRHPVCIGKAWKNSVFSQLIRMWKYHRAAVKLHRNYPFDVLVYNHALVGLVSAYLYPKTIGMINDYNNFHPGNNTFRSRSDRWKRTVLRWTERTMARKAWKVIVNSDYLRNEMIETYKLAPEKVYRLYKGIDPPLSAPLLHPIDVTQPVRVIFIKNDYELGGLKVLVEALASLSYEFLLTIIGPKPDKALNSLFSDVNNIKPILLGRQTSSEVTEKLADSQILCIPSFNEALGVANIQGMSLGISIVTTCVGGIPEVLDHGRCGWMVSPGDAVALSRAIKECIENPELRLKKQIAGWERSRHFSKERLFENFIRVLSHSYSVQELDSQAC